MSHIDKLKKLREKTGVSYHLCLKAIKETKGDLKKAEELLIKWGAEKISEKQQRKTSQGGIFAYVHHNLQIAAMVELQSETDFVANNEEFKNLGHQLAMQIASLKPQSIDELLNQQYIRDGNKKIADLINEAVLKFGEKIVIKRFVRWEVGEKEIK